MFYALIGLGVLIIIIAILNQDRLTRILGRMGRSSGEEEGPEPGDGAVIHNSSGEADFDGSPGDVPPRIKESGRDQAFPPKRAAG
jgi:hypothetical protein